MLNNPTNREKIIRSFVLILLAWILINSFSDLYQAGFGSGHFVGRFSLKWATTLVGFGLLFIAIFLSAQALSKKSETAKSVHHKLTQFRFRIGWLRWLVLAGVLISFPWFFLYSKWVLVFTDFSLKILLFIIVVIVSAWLMSDNDEFHIGCISVVASIILAGGIYSLLFWFSDVSSYPFSLYWSEGNRLWDYSLLFNPDLYNYPSGELTNTVSYPPGRLLPFGLPFLLPQVSIAIMRFWNSFLFVFPAMLLGWIAIKPSNISQSMKVIFALWVFLFLNQGPIWTSLVIVAILVILVRKSKLIVAIPIMILAGYFAALSRPTWIFAPSMWIAMIVFVEPLVEKRKLNNSDWIRAVTLGIAGILGSIWMPRYLKIFPEVDRPWSVAAETAGSAIGDIWQQAINLLTHQSLLWYRLLPNPTFAIGIVFGVILASVPLIFLLISVIKQKPETLNKWQVLAIFGVLAAFLTVGLVASVKVGGGTNLHNLDMYFVGLFIVTAMIFGTYSTTQFEELFTSSSWLGVLMLMVVTVPAILPVISSSPREIVDAKQVDKSLERINQFVDCAEEHGEVLFLDQRQLLTFGLVSKVSLVLEYEKKIVMDEALANNENYFNSFYADLDAGRFSLIVADRQFINYKDTTQSLAAENNAWIKWVSIPLLQRYDSVREYKQVGVELFMPQDRGYQCP